MKYSGPEPLRPFATFNGVPYRRFTIEQRQDPIEVTRSGILGGPADAVRKFVAGQVEVSGTFERTQQGSVLKTIARNCTATVQLRRSGRLLYVVTGHEVGSEYAA